MSYSRFRLDNTEGYTPERLAELNRRYTERVNAGPATAYAGPKGDDPEWLAWRTSELDQIAARIQAEYDTEYEADPAIYACPDGPRCGDPECAAENLCRAGKPAAFPELRQHGDALIRAAARALACLENMTTIEFSAGDDRPARLALRLELAKLGVALPSRLHEGVSL